MKTVCGNGNVAKGIDVSQWQGAPDWARVRAAGVEFAFVRVSDGERFRDSQFARNWEGARRAGLYRGAYQFFRPGQDAVAQAELVLDAVGRLDPGELPLVVDVEAADGLSPAEVAAAVQAWVTRVTCPVLGHGRAPLVYASPAFWAESVGGASPGAACPLWVAHWGVTCPLVPAPWETWTFWQTSNTGRVDGISGDVDLDVFRGSSMALRSFASGVGVATAVGAGAVLAAAFLGGSR